MDELSPAVELAFDYGRQLQALSPDHELLKYILENMSPELDREFTARFWNKPFPMEGQPGNLVSATIWANYVVALKKAIAELSLAKIEAAISQLDENGHKLHEQALAEGHNDEVCPNAGCGTVLLAHHHFIRCGIQGCPMVSRQNLNPDGNPRTLLDKLIDAEQVSNNQQGEFRESPKQ
jgi:hypothetical protein